MSLFSHAVDTNVILIPDIELPTPFIYEKSTLAATRIRFARLFLFWDLEIFGFDAEIVHPPNL